ncbi:MAG: CD0415/CD1112 family protein [Bacillus sp. (in: Bacteria)]|nr:CD0415/CD1112 family protein [Bacillus sp. (in: firmicutes)]
MLQSIYEALYSGMYSKCNKLFIGMFDSLNEKIGAASNTLRQTPEAWSSDAYNTVKTIAETAFVPIATCFIACILAWELVHLLQESNQMGGQIFEKLLVLLFTCVICVYMCSKSFDIVMFFFRLGANVTSKIGGSTIGQLGENVSIDNFLPQVEGEYDFGIVLEIAGDLILLAFANIIIFAIGVIIYIKVILWFLEFLIYASAASIPNATWMNKEWSQVGMNYIRKMLAVAFEEPFMLLLFAVYGGVVSGIGSGDFKESVIMIIGCGIALAGMMFKTGNISASIFNAH